MEHLDEQSVIELVAGELDGAAANAAHAHLDRCAECRSLVAQVLRSDAPTGDAIDVQAITVADAPRARHAPRPAPTVKIEEYKLLELLGRGGMGSVYRARDTLLDREVAIKLVSRERARDTERFLIEARAVARIRHQNVVVVHRVGVADDQPYIVYDLVRGRTFAELGKPTPWPKVLELAVGMARGLAAAHACGVLHRDLKPANVMLDEREDVVLVDFGLAKLDEREPAESAGESSDPSMTATGVRMGTPRYMAPESWQGAPATPQTDIYSFGLVVYELLAGRLPFAESAVAELGKRVGVDDPPPLHSLAPWVPPLFANSIDACIARDPGRRPVSAAKIAEGLEALQRGRAFDAIERDRVRRAPSGNPYLGAQPFGYEHQGVFFGRRAELRSLLDQMMSRSMVVVAGEPGVGKTSLCMAGVLPLIARGVLGGARKWVPVLLTPGADPLAALASAIAGHIEGDQADVPRRLRDDPDPLLAELRAGHRGGCTAHVLFIDQLEDLVTLAPRDEACRFAELLAKLAEPAPTLRVLATLRISEMMAVAQLPGLSSVIGSSLYLVLEPRDEAALREIVVEPALLGGRAIAADVAQSLVDAAVRGELRLGELETRLASLWDQTLVT